MKIAQVVSTFPPYKGGMGNVAWNYARLLTARGHEVTTFTPLYKKNALPHAEEASERCGRVIRLKPVLQYGNAAFLPQLTWKLGNFDAVIFHYPFFGAVKGIFNAKFFGLFKGKLILQYHMDVTGLSPLAWAASWPSKLLLPGLIRQADSVLSASLDYVSESNIKKYYKKHPNKFIELPFGADLKRFYPAGDELGMEHELGRGALGGSEDVRKKKTILFVGGLDQAHYFKGLGILLRAVKGMKTVDAKLLVIGEGALKESYGKLALELGINGRVKFIGSVPYDELPKYYREADVFVLPSVTKGEAFGLVLVEALASGVPVIASRLAGVRSVFTDGREGLLNAPGNSKDLSEKIDFILSNEDLRKRMGKAARKLALEKYDWEKVGDRLEEIISTK